MIKIVSSQSVILFFDTSCLILSQASKSKESFSFFSLPEFEEWKQATDNWKSYKVKYYKGLF